MKSEKSIKRHFSNAAAIYAEGSSFHLELNQKLTNASLRVKNPSDVLELGCGAGQLSAAISRQFPNASITALDLSSEMIKFAREQYAELNSISWAEGEAITELKAVAPESFDLILSSSSIQWIKPYSKLFKAIFSSLRENGVLLFDCITEGTLATLKDTRRELALDSESLPEKLPSVFELSQFLSESGFEIVYCGKETYYESHSSFKELLRSLKARGFTANIFSQGSRGLTRGELSELEAKYPVQRDGSNRAEFVSAVFFARKKSKS